MFCDPKQPYGCPDLYCPKSNITFTVCKLTAPNNSSTSLTATKPIISFESCPDTSTLNCDAFGSCLTVIAFVNQFGTNSTNAADRLNNLARCKSGQPTKETYLSPSAAASISANAAIASASSDASAKSAASSSLVDAMTAPWTLLLLILACVWFGKRSSFGR